MASADELFLDPPDLPIPGIEKLVIHIDFYCALDGIAGKFAAVGGKSDLPFVETGLVRRGLKRDFIALHHAIGEDGGRAGVCGAGARQGFTLQFQDEGDLWSLAIRIGGSDPFPRPGRVGRCLPGVQVLATVSQDQ